MIVQNGPVEKPKVAWLVSWVKCNFRHKYPKLGFVGGFFDERNFVIFNDLYCLDQEAFLTKNDCLWRVGEDPANAIFDSIPYRFKNEFQNADEVVFKLVEPLVVCAFCHRWIERGSRFFGGDLFIPGVGLLTHNYIHEYDNIPFSSLVQFVDNVVRPLNSFSPILFGDCKACGDTRRKFKVEVAPLSDAWSRDEYARVFRKITKSGKDQELIDRRLHFLVRWIREKTDWGSECEMLRAWDEARQRKIFDRHVRRRPMPEEPNFFAMVNATRKLGELELNDI